MQLHHHFTEIIEKFAPLGYQESYDNSGWQCGNKFDQTTGILITLDVTEEVIHEAIEKQCNLIIAHHPVLFPHVKRITADDWVGRLLLMAIQHKISIYSAHTNLDNVLEGVNMKLAQKLKLQDVKVLSPMGQALYKLAVFVPVENAEHVRQAIFNAGGGGIGNYSECSFNTNGTGTFKPLANSQPFLGQPGGARENVSEIKIEVIVPKTYLSTVVSAMKEAHPYEEVAYDIVPLNNTDHTKGAGMYGTLKEEMSINDFLGYVKSSLSLDTIKFTHAFNKTVKRVGVCGGSGSFLMQQAIRVKCDAFITSDIKYHQFFEVENKILIADIGHYESEQFTSEIFYDILKENFSNFAIYISKTNTNPIKYFS